MVDTNQQTKISAKTSLLVIGLLAAGGLAGFAWLGSKTAPKTTVKPSPTVVELNETFIVAATDYVNSLPTGSISTLDTLTVAATKRHQAMSALLPDNPKKFIELVVPTKIRQQLPTDVQLLVEQESIMIGQLEMEHQDFFATNTSKKLFFLATSDDATTARTPVYFSIEPTSELLGATVKLHGWKTGDSLAVAGTAETRVVLSAASAAAPVTGQKKIAVILINFQNNASEPVTPDQARDSIFNDADSVNRYYQEISSFQASPPQGVALIGKNNTGGVNGNGDVFGWITIPVNNSPCAYATWSNVAYNSIEAIAPGSLSGYDKRVYMFNGTGNCGQLNGVSGADIWVMGAVNKRTLTHEIGHWFGTDHASTTNCTSGTASPYSICQDYFLNVDEYGDPYEPMGQAYRHMANYRKGLYGWYQPSATVDVTTTSAQIPLEPSTTPGAGTKVLRIPRKFYNGQLTEYYYLEYRRPFGTFENYAPSSPEFNGLLVRIAPPYGTNAHSYLLDATPAMNFGDAALAAGKELYDAYHGVRIKTFSVAPSQAAVDVTITCVQQAPSLVPISFSLPLRPGMTGTTVLSAANNNNPFVCSGSGQFSVTASLPAGWSMQPIATLTLGANTTTPVSLAITPAASASDGFYLIPVTLTRQDVSTPVATYSVLYQVDSIPPTVAITQPAANSTLPTSGTVTISTDLTSYDDAYDVELRIDSNLVKQCPDLIQETCTYEWLMNSVTSGSHTITATSIDSAGNVGTASISVTYPSSGAGGLPCGSDQRLPPCPQETE